jgi:hypothetical protein
VCHRFNRNLPGIACIYLLQQYQYRLHIPPGKYG